MFSSLEWKWIRTGAHLFAPFIRWDWEGWSMLCGGWGWLMLVALGLGNFWCCAVVLSLSWYCHCIEQRNEKRLIDQLIIACLNLYLFYSIPFRSILLEISRLFVFCSRYLTFRSKWVFVIGAQREWISFRYTILLSIDNSFLLLSLPCHASCHSTFPFDTIQYVPYPRTLWCTPIIIHRELYSSPFTKKQRKIYSAHP